MRLVDAFGGLLDSKVFLISNSYCNVRANSGKEITSRPRSGTYVWWPKNGGSPIAPILGFRHPDFGTRLRRTHLRMEVAAMLLRLCRRVGSLSPTNLRALPQFDGSAADQSQSPRALW